MLLRNAVGPLNTKPLLVSLILMFGLSIRLCRVGSPSELLGSRPRSMRSGPKLDVSSGGIEDSAADCLQENES